MSNAATTQRLPLVRIPGGSNGRQPCDCRRQRHVRLPAELGGVWTCLGCGSRFAESERKPLRQRVREWAAQHQADLLMSAAPAAIAIGWALAMWLE